MTNLINMVCQPGTACALTSGFGLPEILLWVLAFAVTYATMTTLKIIDKKASALISMAIGFFVIMAAPAALITTIATMSTGLIVLIIGALVAISMTYAVGPVFADKDEKGNIKGTYNILQVHGTTIGLVIVGLTAVLFWFSGGAQLIGLTSLPSIGTVPWILVIVGAAVLWMLKDSK
ncbi:MAG: hypothetical protein JW700_02305 [Candidatus Aenigmarchaeota archaeon]|nr:hypothetical protein [Candidatus Aenigmarchaeota archaeon]